MAERYYIDEIFENNLEQTMEHDFEKDYPQIKAIFTINSIRTQILMSIYDRGQNYVASFVAREFDCVRAINAESNDKKSDIVLDDKDVKRWYLRWMNVHFDTYKEDYIANINKIANEDLGI